MVRMFLVVAILAVFLAGSYYSFKALNPTDKIGVLSRLFKTIGFLSVAVIIIAAIVIIF